MNISVFCLDEKNNRLRVRLVENPESGHFTVLTEQCAEDAGCSPWELRDGWRLVMVTGHATEVDAIREYQLRVENLKTRGF